MREHGVLKRVLLIYREGINRLQAEEPDPSQALNASAGIIRSFIEDYHEHLEEQYVFPNLERAAKLTDITTVLRAQHQRGRVLTDSSFRCHRCSGCVDQPERKPWCKTCTRSSGCWPHEAREDTVVFPALRDVLPAQKFRELAEIFEDEEHKWFGPAGFEGVVDKVADIEKSLGIYDLSQFTPT